MSEPGFTPGPWKWVKGPAWHNIDYEGRIGMLVGDGDKPILDLGNTTNYYPECGSEPRSESDVRLIAKAPEMYALLREIMSEENLDYDKLSNQIPKLLKEIDGDE